MKPPVMTRQAAIQDLSLVRYEQRQKLISQTTFWRWCGLAGIDRVQVKNISADEYMKLLHIARSLQQGFTYSQIQTFLEV